LTLPFHDDIAHSWTVKKILYFAWEGWIKGWYGRSARQHTHTHTYIYDNILIL